MLETLVTLVIVGLISALLMGMFGQALRLQRYGALLDAFHERALAEAWFRQSVAGLIADHRKADHVFRGTEEDMRGLTLAVLDQTPGIPEPVTWILKRRGDSTRLIFQSLRHRWGIRSWRDRVTFRYRDVSGTWHDHWPPGPEFPQLPVMIGLFAGEKRQVWAAIRQRATPRPYLRDSDWLE